MITIEGLKQMNNHPCKAKFWITAFGKRLPGTVWAEETGIPVGTLRNRIQKLNWPPEQALSIPVSHDNKSLREEMLKEVEREKLFGEDLL